MPNGKCYMHGGASTGPPKGTKSALKHGIYARHLDSEEVRIWHDIPIGTLDDELRLARIQLRRSLKAKRTEEISVFLRRVERLEATRAAMADKGHETMDAREAARQIWQAVREIDELTIIPPPSDF